MGLVTDFLLLAASGAACFYCWVLAKRIKTLTNAEEGFGAGVVALTQSADEMKTAITETKTSAEQTAAQLEALVKDADERARVLKELLNQLTEMTEDVVSEAEQARQTYLDTLTPFITEANDAADRLFEAIENAPSSEAPETTEPVLLDDGDTEEDDDDDLVEIDAGAPVLKKAVGQ
ncbi:MAG: hypothetical protein AAGC77_05280 [Pseudomonadota bacterium]